MPATKSMPKAGRNPKGGLTAKGRAWFAAKEDSHLKAGVTGPADTPEKMHRKGSFLVRMFTHPRGPMLNAKGEPTTLALSANAWGEPIPKTISAAQKTREKAGEVPQLTRRIERRPHISPTSAFSIGAAGPHAASTSLVNARTRSMLRTRVPLTIRLCRFNQHSRHILSLHGHLHSRCRIQRFAQPHADTLPVRLNAHKLRRRLKFY